MKLGLAYPFILLAGYVVILAIWPIELWQDLRDRLRDEAVRGPLLPNRRKGVMVMLVTPPKKHTELRN